MAAQPKKIEVRPISGLPYRRAGQIWGPGWKECPPELLKDSKAMDGLSKDTNIEIKVDGKVRFHGGKPSIVGAHEHDPSASVEDQLASAHARIGELEEKLAAMQSQQLFSVGLGGDGSTPDDIGASGAAGDTGATPKAPDAGSTTTPPNPNDDKAKQPKAK